MFPGEIWRLVKRDWEDPGVGGQAMARVSGYLVSAGKLVRGETKNLHLLGEGAEFLQLLLHKSLICPLKRSGNG